MVTGKIGDKKAESTIVNYRGVVYDSQPKLDEKVKKDFEKKACGIQVTSTLGIW